MGHGGDVIAELTSDHREVEEMFGQIKATPEGDPQRKSLLDQLTIELVRHSVAEEQYLYPAVREHVQNGGVLADRELADHARIEEILKGLEQLEPGEGDFTRMVNSLEREVTNHVQDEEDNLFVRLRESCSQEMLDELGDKIRAAKKTAPTRPHPAAPSAPPANKLLAPGAGLVDRARDFVTGRGK
ncbi:hemerythrin domain-containing protein [Streptomyces sp. NPDC051776]|uniref:hemerythrin domain-containing protein n=1 Tax=Streptomyces sp. NPDC051776 TaxID=3155414 RepID=UPI003425E692